MPAVVRQFHGAFFAVDETARSPFGIPVMYATTPTKLCVFYDNRSIEELRPEELRHAYVFPGVHTSISAYLVSLSNWNCDINVHDEAGAFYGSINVLFDEQHGMFTIHIKPPWMSEGRNISCFAEGLVVALRKQLAYLLKQDRVVQTSTRYLTEGAVFQTP